MNPDGCDGLKPCPFCGGAAEMREIHDPDEPNDGGCYIAELRGRPLADGPA